MTRKRTGVKKTGRKPVERPLRLRVGPTSVEPDKHGCPDGFYSITDRSINVEVPSARSEAKKPAKKSKRKEEKPDPVTVTPAVPHPKRKWGTGRPSEMDDDGWHDGGVSQN